MNPLRPFLRKVFAKALAPAGARTARPHASRFRPGLLSLEERDVPSADFFADAIALTGTQITVSGSNVGATAEPGEPAGEGTNGDVNSVWWNWTAPASGQVEINTFGSSLDTVLAVYTGTGLDKLNLFAANDDALDTQSQVLFSATAGTTYHISVDGYGGDTGDFTLRLGTTPANDNFANSTVVPGGTVTGTNLAATQESGEGAGTSGAINTVWWSWTAPTTGEVTVNTHGSDFDTILAVHTGSAMGGLTMIAVNDDSSFPSTTTSQVTFQAYAGTTYHFAVDGYQNATGNVVLNLPEPVIVDSPPIIADQAFAVNENASGNTAVGSVVAEDDAGGLTYAITGGDGMGLFAIDAATGVIRTATGAALDYEAKDSYQLVVEVTDIAGQSASAAVAITVNDVNDAPVLDNSGSMSLRTMELLQLSNTGTLVSDLLASAGGGRIADQDAGALTGIAITAADTAHGSWEFSTNGGSTWVALGAVSDGSARLLAADANTRIRFVPALGYTGTLAQAITFRAWDQTAGSNGGFASTVVSGGTTAFSAQTETASLNVRSLLGWLL
jgi:hypothetical protein